ncbi:MAG TPA: hypothetical protein VH575_01620 [Gemmataceae bacterium]
MRKYLFNSALGEPEVRVALLGVSILVVETLAAEPTGKRGETKEPRTMLIEPEQLRKK